MERKGVITAKGKPLTLIGPDLTVGAKAPDFQVLTADLAEVGLGAYAGKIKLVSVTPSLDTPVCDIQLRRLNSAAAELPQEIVTLNISMDLPFAISRFCTTAGIDSAIALSDHRHASFGAAYGVLVKETRLLARAIFIIDQQDIIRYQEIVPEQSEHPDYDKALAALASIAGLKKAA